ncbi:MAG: GbsR/MarR family transcriptional regulator [Magnetovibrionaceae bacterium]
MELTPTTEKFVLHWGEMGSRWGVNRTVAQIHALLFVSTEPINAETIAEVLGVARSNVSTSLKELQSWDLIKTVHVMGDRRDYFETDTDPWDIAFKIAEGRKHRELDPTLSLLRDCVTEGERDRHLDPEVLARMKATLDFMEQLIAWYLQVSKLPTKTLLKILKLGAGVQNLLGRK